jgi:hypothetical protein
LETCVDIFREVILDYIKIIPHCYYGFRSGHE